MKPATDQATTTTTASNNLANTDLFNPPSITKDSGKVSKDSILALYANCKPPSLFPGQFTFIFYYFFVHSNIVLVLL